MRYFDVLQSSTDLRMQIYDFDREIESILGMHRFLVRIAESEFDAAYNAYLSNGDPEYYDGGDAIYDAERELGINPVDVTSHAGMMALTRAMSLSEMLLARMAGRLIHDSEHWIFPNGKLWPRGWAGNFYKSCLNSPFKLDTSHYRTLLDFRDLYVHGYGVSFNKSSRDRLAERLYSQIPTGPISPEERDLGYPDGSYFFGDGSGFDTKRRELFLESMSLAPSLAADMSPLSTRRSLLLVKDHMSRAHEHLLGGIKDGLNADNCAFVREVNAWWERFEAKRADASQK